MTSLAVLLSNSKMLSIISRSLESIVPDSSPMSTIMRISSSVTFSSSPLSLIPNSRSIPAVETDSSQIIGFMMTATTRTTGVVNVATFMGACMAMRLGTSSPSTSVKNDRMMVITTTESVLRAFLESAVNFRSSISQLTSLSEKFSAANALPRNPASVMPICIADRNEVGCSTSLSRRAAFLLPSSASFLSLFALSETTAISDAAKNAFTRISKNCKSNCRPMGSSKKMFLL